MTPVLLASALTSLLLAQAAAKPGATPEPPPPTPAPTILVTPVDEFGPDVKAWLDANKAQDKDAADRALTALQRRRAERNLLRVDEVAAVIGGRAESREAEGNSAEAASAYAAAAEFTPDAALPKVRLAETGKKAGDAWSALDFAWANPLEEGRLRAGKLLGLLVIAALFVVGFALALLVRYAAVFSHDVAEGLSGPLKSLALFMAVLFLALPLAGFMGWGYLPFWWMALLFIFESKAEKAVSIVLLVALALASLALPMILHQRAVDTAPNAAALYQVATGGTSVESEAVVRERQKTDPADVETALLASSLDRRGGRLDAATAALAQHAAQDPRFANNASALEFLKSNFPAALTGFSAAAEASLPARDRATALYNLSQAQMNTLAFDAGKESRAKGDALDAPLLARYDRYLAFDKDGSTLHAPPDIVPASKTILGNAIPTFALTKDNAGGRLALVAIALLLFIPGIMKFRGAQSFSKQCPKCGTTFCWLCQTRSTSQDVCSQCHHLFVVKKGIPPAARAAKAAEISRYVTIRSLLHRITSLVAPGAGHLSVGHISLGLPLLLLWSIGAGGYLTVRFLAPSIVSGGYLGATMSNGFAALAALTYVAAQALKAKAPVVAPAPRRKEREV